MSWGPCPSAEATSRTATASSPTFSRTFSVTIRPPHKRPQTTGPPGGAMPPCPLPRHAHSRGGLAAPGHTSLGDFPAPQVTVVPPQYFQHYLQCRCALGCLVCTCLPSPPSRSLAPHRAASVSCVPSRRACGGLHSCGDALSPCGRTAVSWAPCCVPLFVPHIGCRCQKPRLSSTRGGDRWGSSAPFRAAAYPEDSWG